MTSKEKLLQLRHDFYNNDTLKYDSIAYFTAIEKDLDRLEKYEKAKVLIKKRYVDVRDILYISKQYVKEIWVDAYNSNKHAPNKLTQEEFVLLKEVLK